MTIPNDANEYLPGTIQIPSSLLIEDITNSFPMVITVSVDPVTASNTYQEDQLVRLNVSKPYGMFQANGLQGKILLVDGNDITVDIDSRLFDIFVIPSGYEGTPASLSPAGSRNLQYITNNDRLVPFQSLNDRGN